MRNVTVTLKALAMGGLLAAGSLLWVGAGLVRSVVAVLRIV
jgi:hypothetical protein